MIKISISDIKRAIAVSIVGGIIYTIYYALKQFPPYYLPSLYPLGDVLLFVLIGMIGAYVVTGKKTFLRLITYGALTGAIAGSISAILLAILHAIDYPPEAITSLGSIPYYAVLYGYWLLTFGITTLVLGVVGAIIYWIVTKLVRMTSRPEKFQ